MTRLSMIFVSILMCVPSSFGGQNPPSEKSYRQRIEADWAAQEQRAGRTMDDPQAIRDLIGRTKKLFLAIETLPNAPDLKAERTNLLQYSEPSQKIESLDRGSRIDLYKQIRWIERSTAFRNPLMTDQSILFMTRKRFICQMLHEYLGYYYDYADISGGGIYIRRTSS